MPTPCLLIAYSRTLGISNLISSLNPKDISRMYLSIDGAKSEEVYKIQSQIKVIVEDFCSKNSIPLRIWQREVNLGLAKSIITAVDWFYANEDFGIVLEDDLVVSPDLFEFIEVNKKLLYTNQKLLLISGNQFYQRLDAKFSINWTNYPLIWGWATTSEKWLTMRHGILFYKIEKWRGIFNKVENFWRVGSMRVRSGQIDTWDIPLVLFMLTTNHLCITPSLNLVSNQGNDLYASHTLENVFPLNMTVSKLDEVKVTSPSSMIEIRKYNQFLENKIFKIKFRHHFIYIYYLFFSHIFRSDKSNKLLESLATIEIPD